MSVIIVNNKYSINIPNKYNNYIIIFIIFIWLIIDMFIYKNLMKIGIK